MSNFKEEISAPLSLAQAAQYLEVSKATLRNWLRSGVVDDLWFESIKTTKIKIAEGRIERLNKRANKNHHSGQHSHHELLSNKLNYKKLELFLVQNSAFIKEILFCAFLKHIEFHRIPQNHKLHQQLKLWNLHSHFPLIQSILFDLEDLQINWEKDCLNFIYQTGQTVGGKQKGGAYYTPKNVVQSIIKNTIKSSGHFHDPCCGGGHFLVEAYLQLKRLNSKAAHKLVTGCDLDPLAVLVARAVLTIESNGQMDVINQIRVKNSLLEGLENNQYDFICTNPPWGAQYNNEEAQILSKRYRNIKSLESFSYFLEASLNGLIDQGQLGFVLPVSFLNVKIHNDIRKFLLQNFKIKKIEFIGHKFSGVFTESILLFVQKVRPDSEHKIQMTDCSFNQFKILENKDCAFPRIKNNKEEKFLEKIGSLKCQHLCSSQWALGIVTGDNKRFLCSKKNQNFKAIIKGRDIRRFLIDSPKQYISSDISLLQQVAPLEKYLASPKLVYRFICSELVFAIDRNQTLTLNSANILIPALEGYSIESVCGVLNSKLAQVYFKIKFHSIKVLRSQLAQFPFPVIDKQTDSKLASLVKKLELNFSDEVYHELNRLVMELYKLDKDWQDFVESKNLSTAFNPRQSRELGFKNL